MKYIATLAWVCDQGWDKTKWEGARQCNVMWTKMVVMVAYFVMHTLFYLC
jgi:hypothetical protein